MAALMIYGASGFTGRLACERAKNLNLEFVVAGRSEDKIQALASDLHMDYRIFEANQPEAVDSALASIGVLLNCAGPYKRTARPLAS